MISFTHKGSFKNTETFLSRLLKKDYMSILHNYGRKGVSLLANATPVSSGLTASSWDYNIKQTKSSIKITWTNSNKADGVPIVILLQYGHATKNGGFVNGNDFINPVMRPLFEKIANDVWKEVTK